MERGSINVVNKEWQRNKNSNTTGIFFTVFMNITVKLMSYKKEIDQILVSLHASLVPFNNQLHIIIVKNY